MAPWHGLSPKDKRILKRVDGSKQIHYHTSTVDPLVGKGQQKVCLCKVMLVLGSVVQFNDEIMVILQLMSMEQIHGR